MSRSPDIKGGDIPSYFDKLIPNDLIIEDSINQWIKSTDYYLAVSASDPVVRGYLNVQYGLEDISDNVEKHWLKSRAQLRELAKTVTEYGESIYIGSERLEAQLDALIKQTESLKGDPKEPTVTFNSVNKFNIDGILVCKKADILNDQVINTIAFFDKVYLPLMEDFLKLLDNLSFDPEDLEKIALDFSRFSGGRWFKRGIKVGHDKRFREDADILRTKPAQGNKALYYAGPTPDHTTSIRQWSFIVNLFKGISLKYFMVPDLKKLGPDDDTIDVDSPMNLKQRLNYLRKLNQQILKRRMDVTRVVGGLKKIDIAIDKLRAKARVADKAKMDDLPHQAVGRGVPTANEVINSVTGMVGHVHRLTTDYHNALATQLRTMGALTYVIQTEIECYNLML